jgi:AcrR family transcriptional regulator
LTKSGTQRTGDTKLAPVRKLTRRERTETALIDAATRVFLDRGYDGATTGEIARSAGVAAGTYYLYFEDKRAAFSAVSGRAARDLLSRLQPAIVPGMTAATLTRIALELVAEFWRTDPALSQLILSGGPALGIERDENGEAFVDEVAATIAGAGIRRGEEAMALALYLVGLSQQLGHLIVARPDAHAAADALISLASDRL